MKRWLPTVHYSTRVLYPGTCKYSYTVYTGPGHLGTIVLSLDINKNWSQERGKRGTVRGRDPRRFMWFVLLIAALATVQPCVPVRASRLRVGKGTPCGEEMCEGTLCCDSPVLGRPCVATVPECTGPVLSGVILEPESKQQCGGSVCKKEEKCCKLPAVYQAPDTCVVSERVCKDEWKGTVVGGSPSPPPVPGVRCFGTNGIETCNAPKVCCHSDSLRMRVCTNSLDECTNPHGFAGNVVEGEVAIASPVFPPLIDPNAAVEYETVEERNIVGFGEAQRRHQKHAKWCYAACAQMIASQNVHQEHVQCWYATNAANIGHSVDHFLDCCNSNDVHKLRCQKMGDVAILQQSVQVSSTPRLIQQGTVDAVYSEFVQEMANNRLVSFGVQAKAGYGHSVLGFGHKTTDGKRMVHIYDPEHGGSAAWIEFPSGNPKYERIEDMRIHHSLAPGPQHEL